MLVQSLVLIAAIVLVSGAILTSTLVTAKAALHQTVLAKTRAAMEDATAMFVTSTANNVAATGASPNKPWPAPTPVFESLCVSAASTSKPPPDTCTLKARIVWNITGTTLASEASHTTQTSFVENLAATVNEQRLSATIAVRVSDNNGNIYGDSARRVTARIIEAKPYVVITAIKDVSTYTGKMNATEGDSGGTVSRNRSDNNLATPNPGYPSRDVDTRVRTSLSCKNSITVSQNEPTSSSSAATSIDSTVRPFGNRDWAYESPCNPSYVVDDAGAPSGYATSIGEVYYADPRDSNRLWRKGDQDNSFFPK